MSPKASRAARVTCPRVVQVAEGQRGVPEVVGGGQRVEHVDRVHGQAARIAAPGRLPHQAERLQRRRAVDDVTVSEGDRVAQSGQQGQQAGRRIHVAERPEHPAVAAQLQHLVPAARRLREQVRAAGADLAGGVDGQRPLAAAVVVALMRAAGRAGPERRQVARGRHLIQRDRAAGLRDQPDVRVVDHHQVVVPGQVLDRGDAELLQRPGLPADPDRAAGEPLVLGRGGHHGRVAPLVMPGRPAQLDHVWLDPLRRPPARSARRRPPPRPRSSRWSRS